MVLQQRQKKTMGGVLCALLLTMFFESSLCAAAHLEEHATADCGKPHIHNSHCDVPASPEPCRDDCSLGHAHEQLVAASTRDSSNSESVLPPSSLLLPLARLDAPSSSVSPVTLALPPPELKRSTVLLI